MVLMEDGAETGGLSGTVEKQKPKKRYIAIQEVTSNFFVSTTNDNCKKAPFVDFLMAWAPTKQGKMFYIVT